MVDPSVRAILDEIRAFGEQHGGMWNISPETGRTFHVLLQILNARRALEIGTSNGYSTIWLADALALTGGQLITLEVNPEKVRMATENLARAGRQDLVEIVEGDARETIRRLEGPFDFIFIDADKESYGDYLDAALPLLRPGGVLAADNVDSHDGELRDFVERIEQDAGLESFRLPFGGGQIVAYKRPPSQYQPMEYHRY